MVGKATQKCHHKEQEEDPVFFLRKHGAFQERRESHCDEGEGEQVESHS